MAADDLLIPVGIVLLIIFMSGSGDNSRDEEEPYYEDFNYPKRVEFRQRTEGDEGFYSRFQDYARSVRGEDVYGGSQYAMTIGNQSETTYLNSMKEAENGPNVTNGLLDQINQQINSMSSAVQLLNQANEAARQAQDTGSFEKLREIKEFVRDTFVAGKPLWTQYLEEMGFRKSKIHENFDDNRWKFDMDDVPMSQEEKRRCLGRIEDVEGELARIREAVEDELNRAERQVDEWGLHQGYSQAYENMESNAYTSPAIASNTYPTKPDFNSAPQAQYSNDASRKRRDAFDDQTLNTLEEVPNQFHIGAGGGQNLNRLFDSAEQEELERELNLDVISNLEDEEASPFQQLPKAPADGPEPPTVSSQIARPKTSLAGLSDRMKNYEALSNSPIGKRTESRLPSSAPPSKFTLVTDIVTTVDGCEQNDLIGLTTYMNHYKRALEKLTETPVKSSLELTARKIRDLVPKNGYAQGSWYSATKDQRGIQGLKGTKVDYSKLRDDRYFQQYTALVNSLEVLEDAQNL